MFVYIFIWLEITGLVSRLWDMAGPLSLSLCPPFTRLTTRCYSTLSHLDASGDANMVDVTAKPSSSRCAVASGKIVLTPEAYTLVKNREASKKGSVLGVAQLAGVMGAKETSRLIPLCHLVVLSHVAVEFVLDDDVCCVEVWVRVRSVGVTGVEMEALCGVTMALLTVYDMTKSASHCHTITDVRLEEKWGGRSGHFINTPSPT